MARLVGQNGHHKDRWYDEIGLFLKKICELFELQLTKEKKFSLQYDP